MNKRDIESGIPQLDSHVKLSRPFNYRLHDFNISYTFTDELTVLENIYALWQKIVDVVKTFEDLEKIINAMIKFLEGEGIGQHVKHLLEIWLEDGTLEELINEALFNSKADKVWVESEIKRILEKIELEVSNIDKEIDGVKKDLSDLDSKKLNISDFENIADKFHFDFYGRIERKADGRLGPVSGDLYYSPQGSCVIEENNSILIAFVNGTFHATNGSERVHTVFAEYSLNDGTLIRESAPIITNHSNGLDYNKETNEVFVAFTNDLHGGADNRVAILDYNNLTLKKVFTPNGLPDGRRVKSYCYDKVTGKQYLTDDQGAFEIDEKYNVTRVINWDVTYLKQVEGSGVRQNTTILNGNFYHLGMGNQHIAVFKNNGELIRVEPIPKYMGSTFKYCFGEEPQSISLKSDGSLYLLSRYGYSGNLSHSTKMISYIFSCNVLKGNKMKEQSYSFNFQTDKPINVDVKSNSFRPDGRYKPFSTLLEALEFAKINNFAGNKILLENGVYEGLNYSGNGETINIIGKNNTVINNMRFFNCNIRIESLIFKPISGGYGYALRVDDGIVFSKNNHFDCTSNKSAFGIYSQNAIHLHSDDVKFINCYNGIRLEGGIIVSGATYENCVSNENIRNGGFTNEGRKTF